MYLSIIIPAFEEAQKIKIDIEDALHFLNTNLLNGEIIIVDDGSTDDTSRIVNQISQEIDSRVKLIRHQKKIGKGAAVKTGVLNSGGEFISYTDAGRTIPYSFIMKGIEAIKNGADIAFGSRKLKDSNIIKLQDWDRRIVSKLFFHFSRIYFNLPKNLTDTQCGFKVYKGEIAKKVFSKLQILGFLFEIEFILLSIKDSYKIVEFPVDWSCDRDSRISVRENFSETIKEILTIKKIMKNYNH